MTEPFSDIQKIFAKGASNPVLSCKDASSGKTHGVDQSDLVEFYKNYLDVVFAKEISDWSSEPILAISEKTESHCPLIGNFVLKSSDDTEIDEINDIHTIIRIYQDAIKTYFKSVNPAHEMICVYLRTNSWWKDGVAYRAFRVQFPYCKTKRDIINSVINPYVTSNLDQEVSGLGVNWGSSIVDIGDHVTLYGSTAYPKLVPPLKFIAVYSTQSENGTYLPLELNNTFSYDKHGLFRDLQEEIDSINSDCDIDDDLTFAIYTLPLFLSVHFYPNKLQYIDSDTESVTESDASSVIIEESDEISEIKSDFDLCNDLVKRLTPKRFNTKMYFLDIGRAFYNATEGGHRGLRAWMNVCGRSKKFNRDFCEQHYDGFENDNVTVKSMGWYFKSDNRKKYETWHNDWCRYAFFDAFEGDHTKVGEAFYKCFWLKYMYTGKRWLEFRRNKLVFIDEIKIKRTITRDFVPHFDILESILLAEKLKLNDRKGSRAIRHRMDKIDLDIEKIVKLKKQLRNENYISSIIKSLRAFFYYEDVSKSLNKNPSLLGCTNCVIELTDEEAVKREGKPEDFITKKIGVHYRADYSYAHPDVKDLLKYLRQVFPNDEIRHYMMKDLASLMYGRNSEKIFRVWIGDTNGSKSVLQKMIRTWLGDYYCDLPAEFFSGKKMNSSGPSPELAQTENARVAFTAEPDDDESWKGARIKKLTGGDSFFARSCGEDGGSIETTFKNIMVLNVVPDITGMDEATKNRFIMVPFEGRWIKPDETRFSVPETFEEQIKAKTYRMDPRFEDQIPRLAAALNWYCIQNYKVYLKEGLQKPKYIQSYMNDYWKRNDPYTAFIDENLEIPKKPDGTVDDNKYITATDLYPVYKRWFKNSYPNFQMVQKARLTTFLSTGDRLGKQRQRRWYGYALRQQQEENA